MRKICSLIALILIMSYTCFAFNLTASSSASLATSEKAKVACGAPIDRSYEKEGRCPSPESYAGCTLCLDGCFSDADCKDVPHYKCCYGDRCGNRCMERIL